MTTIQNQVFHERGTLGRATILTVDDDDLMLAALANLFADDYAIFQARSGEEAVRLVQAKPEICCVVMDIKMAGMNGIMAAREIRALKPSLPVIFHTGYAGEYSESEIDRNESPFDFVTKGESIQKLTRAVRNGVEAYRLRTDARTFIERAENDFGIVCRSTVMREVIVRIHQAGLSDTRVMILGETGTGKELVAQAIHRTSSRARRPLATFNSHDKVTGLVESELFGHVKGAFTDAFSDRMGLFEFADGGSVFLDEIGDLDLPSQAKLLRVLETGEYQRLGDNHVMRRCNVRVISATHRDLSQMAAKGEFREDLYYRLRGVVITLPPLRERREDIPFLVERFRSIVAAKIGVSPKIFDTPAMEMLINQPWPGNVRQLLYVVESALAMTNADLIMADDIVKVLQVGAAQTTGQPRALSQRLREIERTYIVAALVESGLNIKKAAEILEIDPSNLHKKIKSHGLDVAALKQQ